MAEQNKISSLVDVYSEQFGQVLAPITKRIRELMDQGFTAEQSVSQALTEANITGRNQEILLNALTSAVSAGYGAQVADAAATRSVLLHESWAPDKMALSGRLHNVDAVMRNEIVNTIQASMRGNKAWVGTARELYDGYNAGRVLDKAKLPEYLTELEKQARRYLGAGDPEAFGEYQRTLRAAQRNIERLSGSGAPNKALKAAYSQILETTEKYSDKAMDRAIKTAVEEKSRYYAERIARTEISRAWGDGFLARYKNDPLVIAFRWVLSSRHPRFDICDLHANANFYGLGKGVYPKNAFPTRPAHPHCHCGIAPVYEGEVDMDEDAERKLLVNPKFDETAGNRYMRSLDKIEQMHLLGVEGVNAWKKGADWRSYARNWGGHEDDLGRMTAESFGDTIKKKDLPDKLKAEDSSLPKQLPYGAQAKRAWIPAGAEIVDAYVIAGHGTSKTLRNAAKLAERYGGNADEWMKKVGKVVSDLHEYDVHWYEHLSAGSHDHKVKTWKERRSGSES